MAMNPGSRFGAGKVMPGRPKRDYSTMPGPPMGGAGGTADDNNADDVDEEQEESQEDPTEEASETPTEEAGEESGENESDDPDDSEDLGKHPPELAGVRHANETCSTCANWIEDGQKCHQVSGTLEGDDSCSKFYTAKDGGGQGGDTGSGQSKLFPELNETD